MSGSPMMSPDTLAKLKREVLAAEEAALVASRKVKVDRVKHAAQLQELSGHIATAKTIVANSPVAASPLRPAQSRSPAPGPSPARLLQSEKRSLDKRLREQQGTDRILERELAQLQDQFGDVEEVYAPVGPYEYAACEIVSVDKQHIVLIRKDTKECIECSLDQIMPQDPSTVQLPANLVELEYLNQPALLQSLQGIWGENRHQVLCGPNVLCMGHAPSEADDEEVPEGSNPDAVLEERVHSVLAATYDDGQMRALICSGLSGSGKSHTAKKMIDTMMVGFDTEVSSHACPSGDVVDRWTHTCAVLDAFSKSGSTSRCGTFYEVQLEDAPDGTRCSAHGYHSEHLHGVSTVAGVAVTCFGLESNQVVKQRDGHRNFNVFYHLCNAYQSPELAHLRLRPPNTFRILENGAPGEEDPLQFSELEGALMAVGVSNKDLEQVWSVLAAILHLGEIKFTLAEKATVVASPITSVRTIAGLLCVDPVELGRCMSKLGMDPNRKSMGARHRPEVMAEQGRDALARILYDRLFNFLIQRVNDASCADNAKALVAVLDPPGAILTTEESKGTFQTLVRNYVHERMMHTFTTLMFTNHQTRMRAEGVVPLTELEAPDMTGRVEMLEKKGGLFSIVDEVQSLPQASAAALYTKMVNNLVQHPDFSASEPMASPGTPGASPSRQQRCLSFRIRHSFGECVYDVKDFLDVDSDDSFSAALRGLLGTSSPLLLQLFPALLSGDPCRYVSALHMTKTSMVRAQLASLKQMLSPATVMFVHCVSVSDQTAVRGPAREFDLKLVQAHLDAGCVLPSILWQRFGYPISMPMDAFWDRFFMLSPIREASPEFPFPDGTVASGIHALLGLQPFEKHHWRLGRSMVFLRPTPYAMIEDMRMKLLLKSASVITSRIRRQRVFRFMQSRKKALKLLQPLLRGMLTRQVFQRSLEMAFMAFSDKESRRHEQELTAERESEAQARADMAREEEETRLTNIAIYEAHSSEDADLCCMFDELIRSRALNAQWRLGRNPNVPLVLDKSYLQDLDRVCAGNEVFAFDDLAHENPISEYSDIGRAAVDAVIEEANFTIADVLEKMKEEQATNDAEEAVAEINRNRMQAIDEELQFVQSELANRKLLTPHEEHAMMSEAAASQRIRIRMQTHRGLEMEIANAERESTTQQADDNMDNAAAALRAILMQGADSLLAGLDDDGLDPAQMAAQDKHLKLEEGNRFISEILNELITDAEMQAKKQMRTRTAMAETELRKRDLEDRRAKQDLAMDEERLAALQQAKAFKAKQAAKLAEVEAKRAEEAEEAARKAAEQAESRGEVNTEDVSPRRARFRAERNSEWWAKKKDRYDQDQYTMSPGGTLTKGQQSIEDELQSLQALLTMTENASENQTLELLSQDAANDKEFKYMFKYKFKALVVDDDDEMMQ